MKTILILLSFLFMANSNLAHKDTPLQIDRYGNIIGLPKEFSSAKFDSNKKKLIVNNKEIVFPKCLHSYFEEHKNPKLYLSASWYHSKKIMPYYLKFEISNKSANYKYSILINLETLELMYIEKTIKVENGWNLERIKLSEQCENEYKNRIKI